MTETISVLNTVTGQVGTYLETQFANKVLFPRDVFMTVEDGSKPYVRELYKPRSVDEYEADHPVDEPDDEAVVENDLEDEEK